MKKLLMLSLMLAAVLAPTGVKLQAATLYVGRFAGDGTQISNVVAVAGSATNLVSGASITNITAYNPFIIKVTDPMNDAFVIQTALGGFLFRINDLGLVTANGGAITNVTAEALSPAVSATFILKSGDTATGALLTSSATTNGPAQNELATAGWVRGLFGGFGAPYYASSNLTSVGTNVGSGQVLYTFAIDAIPLPSTRSYLTSDFLTNNGYLVSSVTTNTFQQIVGSVEVNSYLAFTGGGGSPTLTIKPEIYYSYDRTNWYGDYAASAQSITSGSTNLYQWVVSTPTITSTNSAGFYIQRRFKCVSVTGSGTRALTFLVGTNLQSGTAIASHIDLPANQVNGGNAYLQADQSFTGQNQFTQPLLSAGVIVTNNFWSRTNSWSGPTNDINLNLADQYFTAASDCSITGFINKSNTVASTVTLTITNSAATNITLRLPAGITTGDGARSYVFTNATSDIISMRYSPIGQTNAVFRLFW